MSIAQNRPQATIDRTTAQQIMRDLATIHKAGLLAELGSRIADARAGFREHQSDRTLGQQVLLENLADIAARHTNIRREAFDAAAGSLDCWPATAAAVIHGLAAEITSHTASRKVWR